ncbi:GNAT family N-acetyltransferase [Amphiplicatus metriothermophilus]|uniref:Putative acetyltransferase n=1 Tax=Amphiplicatus metriothermophilus TaxID=1519374 RepID=A0A239PIJ2_9PROT|nr:N-acetyltransferase [Amphiplicatus metriothermophilus]MBB5518068.1 putative acetyltransferase [Amphiplicatus metriothermophilus]SNT67598.1 putative acetyltransferase [Amphiplicatus metriothermophilus]
MSAAVRIRESEEADRPAIRALVAAAFGREDEARIVEALWADDAMALELAATIDEALVGHCAFSRVALEPPLKGPALGLAPLAVAPAHQRRGIGAALVETGLEICRARGASLVVVLGEPAYYARFGFVPASRLNMRWAALDAGEAFQILDFAGLPASPARRVHYHPAFEAA